MRKHNSTFLRVLVRSACRGHACGYLAVGTLLITVPAVAATPTPGLEGSAWQAVFGLTVVLGVIAGAAWLLRRFSQVVGGGSGPLNTLAVLAVGQKERIVLVQCRDTWSIVGVAPGQVNALHTMARPETTETGLPSGKGAAAPATPGIPAFKQWLERAVKRHEN